MKEEAFALKQNSVSENVVYDPQHNRNFKFNQSYKFSVTYSKYPDCKMHSWICSRQKDANKGKISEVSKKLKIYPHVNTNLNLSPERIIVADVPSNPDRYEVKVVPTNINKVNRAMKT